MATPTKDQIKQLVSGRGDGPIYETKAIPTVRTIATTVACIFIEQWVANYSILSTLLTEIRPQFLSKFFVAVCSTLGVQNITTTEYQPQTSGPSEGFNSTLIS